MTVKKVDATVADFDAHFDKLFAAGDDGGGKGKLKLLLFLADHDASSNLTWWSNVVLLRAYVSDKPTWRDPAHPWRVDPRFRLTGVPTLIRWENGSAAARLGDDEAHLADKIDAVLNASSTAD
ncbi:hypothetical protein E2562_018926 [Oryza meyeriana var. granulata]|uniref:Thioredoxin domain-containing protein n=1 Tax=Oryza meyeriana var. granulata TaxID=110450 RepID=A0A6G1DJ78_9ORYZ|nr:hypothetical protein E2562_018926 [Oryza meyeriana var. granulata]